MEGVCVAVAEPPSCDSVPELTREIVFDDLAHPVGVAIAVRGSDGELSDVLVTHQGNTDRGATLLHPFDDRPDVELPLTSIDPSPSFASGGGVDFDGDGDTDLVVMEYITLGGGGNSLIHVLEQQAEDVYVVASETTIDSPSRFRVVEGSDGVAYVVMINGDRELLSASMDESGTVSAFSLVSGRGSVEAMTLRPSTGTSTFELAYVGYGETEVLSHTGDVLGEVLDLTGSGFSDRRSLHDVRVANGRGFDILGTTTAASDWTVVDLAASEDDPFGVPGLAVQGTVLADLDADGSDDLVVIARLDSAGPTFARVVFSVADSAQRCQHSYDHYLTVPSRLRSGSRDYLVGVTGGVSVGVLGPSRK